MRLDHLHTLFVVDIIDPAVLRPGRLDKVLLVGLPNTEDREDILRTLTKVRRSIYYKITDVKDPSCLFASVSKRVLVQNH